MKHKLHMARIKSVTPNSDHKQRCPSLLLLFSSPPSSPFCSFSPPLVLLLSPPPSSISWKLGVFRPDQQGHPQRAKHEEHHRKPRSPKQGGEQTQASSLSARISADITEKWRHMKTETKEHNKVLARTRCPWD